MHRGWENRGCWQTEVVSRLATLRNRWSRSRLTWLLRAFDRTTGNTSCCKRRTIWLVTLTGAWHTPRYPLNFKGTDFQISAEAVTAKASGHTESHGALAPDLGQATAVSVVAAADGRNRLSILLGYHRVTGPGGRLKGYAGGLSVQRFPLDRGRRHRPDRTLG